MNSPLVRVLLPACFLFVLGSCSFAQAQSSVTRIDAETHLAAGDMKVIELPDALGGKAVSIARDWQPLLVADLPATGDEFSLWLRYKDAPILAKAELADGQKDLSWVWDSPKTLTWKRVGRYTRAQLGKRVFVIRGGDGGQGPVLDCALFATDDAYNPDNDPKMNPAKANGAKTNAKTNDGAAEAQQKANIGEGAAVALGMKDAPDGTLFPASDNASADVVGDEEALGGKAVTSGNSWQPLVSIPLPKDGEAWKVWVHHKGGPFCIKTAQGDRWFWNSPGRYEWRETDVFARTDLPGERLTVARNDGGAKPNQVRVDAVVLAPAKKRDLPPDQPDPALAPRTVKASVNWTQVAAKMPRELWGVNDQQTFDSSQGPSPRYVELFRGLNAPLVRLHQGDLVGKLSDEGQRDWDEAKVKAAFDRARALYGGARLMININTLPSWIAGGDSAKMTEADEDAFAAFCARLVALAKANGRTGLSWEVTNEWDGNMERNGRLPSLWRTWNKSAAAIRKVDPSAKVGGPALTWAKGDWVNGFLDNCPSADFISWHNYASGDIYDPNETVFANVESNIGALARGVKSSLAAHKRTIPTYLTEVNVKYSWDPYERRHQNSVGTVFLALAAREMALSNVSGMTLWVQKGRAYGTLIDGDDKTQPGYELYRWGARSLYGTLAGSSSDDPKALQLLPVVAPDGKRAVLLVNLTRGDIVVPGALSWVPGARVERILASSSPAPPAPKGNDLSLPGFSLALLSAK